jgi:hypothetical protein
MDNNNANKKETHLYLPKKTAGDCLLCGESINYLFAYVHTLNCMERYEKENDVKKQLTPLPIQTPLPTVVKEEHEFSIYRSNKRCCLPIAICNGTGASKKHFSINFKLKTFQFCKLTDLRSNAAQNHLRREASDLELITGQIKCSTCSQVAPKYISVIVGSKIIKICSLDCVITNLTTVNDTTFYASKKRKNENAEVEGGELPEEEEGGEIPEEEEGGEEKSTKKQKKK